MDKKNTSASVRLHDLDFVPYLTEEDIKSAVQRIAYDLKRDFFDKNPIVIVVLTGAVFFATDLIKAMQIPVEPHFVKLKSYQGTTSTGELSVLMDIDCDVRDRHLIVVEDIVDTGLTMYQYLQQLQSRNPASLHLVSLLAKPAALLYPVNIDYVGFAIPNEFVVGYGLDYNQAGRTLPAIYQKS